MAEVYWSYPTERLLIAEASDSLERVAIHAAAQGYNKLSLPYGRVDWGRNMLERVFRLDCADPEAWLVMLDCDHVHPFDIVHRLVTCGKRGVVGAMYRRRGGPFDVLATRRDADGVLQEIDDWDSGEIVPVQRVASGGMAIQRWVFDELESKGFRPPFFRYVYQDDCYEFPSEDEYLCALCEATGIPMWCHTGIYTTHIIVAGLHRDGKTIEQL